MKALFSAFVALFITFSAVAQQAQFAGGQKGITLANAKAEYSFVITDLTIADIDKAAAMYKTSFTVTERVQKGNNINITIKMLRNDIATKRMMLRFMVSLNIQYVTLDGVEYKPDAFFDKYIK
jgi:hypothetical protein